jgi:hypothetical protein
MGRHAAPMTEEPASATPTAPAPAFVAPVAAVPPVLRAPAAPVLAPPAPHDLRAMYAVPAVGGYPVVAPAPTHDDFTAINLLVPQQQTLPSRALLWGVLAVLFSVLWPPAVLAIVFGALGVRRSGRMERAGLQPEGRGRSIAGIVLGIVALLLSVLWAVLLQLALRR